MIRLRNTRYFRNPHRKKSWYSKFGRPSRPSDVAERRDNSSEHCCTFQRSIATDHMKWRPLLYRTSSRQPQQAIAPAPNSNLKCVSRLRVTWYTYLGVIRSRPTAYSKVTIQHNHLNRKNIIQSKKYKCKNNTYLLTPWSRVLLEKLTGSAASQEIPRIF